jgi:cytochrome c biogenesis protein CcdA
MGFLLGIRHAMEADHVAAVASIISDKNSLKQSLKHGAAWGMGHTITLFIFGSAVIIFGSSISQNLAHWLEFAVGVLLVVLGLDVIRRVRKKQIHFHVHRHANTPAHIHAHSHQAQQSHSAKEHRHTHIKSPFPLRALFVGMMHGMAGASALMLLTLSSIQSPWMSLVYISLFGIGSVLGMAALSVVIALPLRQANNNMSKLHTGIQYVLGSFTVLLGANVMIDNFL